MLAANLPTSAHPVADARDPHLTSTALDGCSQYLQARMPANAQKIGADHNEKTLLPLHTPLKATQIGRDDESKEIPKQLHPANKLTCSAGSTIWPILDIDRECATLNKDDKKALKRYRFKLNCYFVTGGHLSFINALAIFGVYFFSDADRARFIDALLDPILTQPVVDTRLYGTVLAILSKLTTTTALLGGFFTSVLLTINANRRKQSLRSYERGGELDHYSRLNLGWPLLASVWFFLISVILITDCSIHRVIVNRTLSSVELVMLIFCVYKYYQFQKTL